MRPCRRRTPLDSQPTAETIISCSARPSARPADNRCRLEHPRRAPRTGPFPRDEDSRNVFRLRAIWSRSSASVEYVQCRSGFRSQAEMDAGRRRCETATRSAPAPHRCCVRQLRRRGNESALTDAGLASKDHARRGQVAGLRSRPRLLEPRKFTVAADQRTSLDPGRLCSLTDHLPVGDRLRDPLDRRGSRRSMSNASPNERRHDIGHHHGPGRRQRADASGEIGAKPVNVVLGDVEVHQPAVHAHPEVDADTEPALGLFAKPAHFTRDVQPGPHGRWTSFSWATGWPNTARSPSPLSTRRGLRSAGSCVSPIRGTLPTSTR